jgi:hypothetical protein
MMTSSIEFVAEDGNEDIIKQIALAQVKQSYDWENLKRILCNKLNTVISVYTFLNFHFRRFRLKANLLGKWFKSALIS